MRNKLRNSLKLPKKLRNNTFRKYRRKALVIMLVLLLIVTSFQIWGFIRPNETKAAWYNSDWIFRKHITIDSDEVDGSSDLTNFPVLVKLSDADLASHAQSDGDDILFTLGDGITQLDHEIESYSTDGTLVAWVRVPTLDYNDDTILYMYYGNSSATNQEDVNGTWKAEYEAVWHMAESTSSTRVDSTDGGLDLSNGNTVAQADGIAGYSADFESGDDDYLSRSNATAGALNVGDEDFAFSFWMNMETYNASNRVFGKFNTSQESYVVTFQDVSGQRVLFDLSANGTSNTQKRNDNATVAVDTWHHIVVTHDSVNDIMTVWVDGISDSRINANGVFNSTADFNVGRIQGLGGTFDFDGRIDEMRMLSEVPTDGWVNTEYNNVFSPDTFLSIAEAEKIDDPVIYFKYDERVDNSCRDGSDTCNSLGNFSNGVFTSNPAWQPSNMCIAGSCLYFDGSDDEIVVTNKSETDQDEGLQDGFTYQGWIRANSDGEGDQGRVLHNATSTYIQIQSEGSDGLADLAFSTHLATSNATVTITDGITLDKWHHIAMTYTDDGDDEITVYIDGINRGTSSNGSGSPASDTQDLVIGGANGATTNNFHGFIDEVKLYQYERTEAEIKSDHIKNAGFIGSTAVLGTNDYSYLSDGLVGYWKMDDSGVESEGETISEASGNNNSGTLSGDNGAGDNGAGMDCTVVGKFGNGCEFDGTDDAIQLTNQSNFNVDKPRSWSAWINTNDSSYGGIIGYEYVSGGSEWLYIQYLNTNNQISVDYFSDFGSAPNVIVYTDNNSIIANQWTFITVTYDPTKPQSDRFTIYVDGDDKTDRGQTVSSGTMTSLTSASAYIGYANLTTGSFSGTLDEIREYTRLLSPAEIKALHNWAPQPVAYWNFDENTGTSTAYDRSVNAYNLALTSAAETDWIPGQFGSGLKFDGSSDYATSTSEDATFSRNTFSVSAWINRTSDSGGIETIVDNRDADNDGWHLSIDASDTVTCSYNSVDATSTTTISTGSWYHLVCTADGTDVNVYIDGVEENSASQSGSISETTDVRIATQSFGTSQGFAGIIDEVRVYNYARTANKIIEDMNGGHPVGGSPIASQVAHWQFDEQYGTTANNKNPSYPTLTGSISGATWFTRDSNNCKGNGCLDYDGTDDVTTVTNATAIDFDNSLSSGFTMSAWINADSDGENNTGEIFDKGSGTYCRTDNQGTTDLDLECNLDLATTDANVNITDALTTNTWHHIAVVHDGVSTIEVFVDGISRGSNTGTGTKSSDTNNLLIGGDSSNNFDGTIDEFKVYTAGLTADQIKVDRNAGSSISLGGVHSNSEASQLSDGAGNAPVGYWPMDENTGTSTTNDKSGNGNTANLTSIAESNWVAGKKGSALSLDGSSDNISISDPASGILDFDDTSDFSISAWFYRNSSSTDDTIIGKGNIDSNSNAGYTIWIDDSTDDLNFQIADGSDTYLINGITSITTSGWNHVVAVFDQDSDANSTIYLNGINDEESTTGTIANIGDTSNIRDLYFGAGGLGTNDPFDGMIDDVKVFNYALSRSQVAYDYNRGAPVGWWRFDECSGATINDASGFGYSGTAIPGTGTSPDNDAVGTCSSGNADEMWNDGTTGKYGASLGFDGEDDYVGITDNSIFDLSHTGQFSWSMWVKPASLPAWSTILGITNSTNNFFIIYANNDSNQISADFKTSSTERERRQSTSNLISTGQWQHIAVTFDGSQSSGSKINIYVNGNLANGTADTQGSLGNGITPSNIWIGENALYSDEEFEGQIDDVRYYNYSLSEAQVRTVMNNGAVSFKN